MEESKQNQNQESHQQQEQQNVQEELLALEEYQNLPQLQTLQQEPQSHSQLSNDINNLFDEVMNEAVYQGINKIQLKREYFFEIKELFRNSSIMISEKKDCAICLEDINEKSNNVSTQCCKQIIHSKCFIRSIVSRNNKICPLCNQFPLMKKSISCQTTINSQSEKNQ